VWGSQAFVAQKTGQSLWKPRDIKHKSRPNGTHTHMGRPGGRLGEAYGEEVAAVGDVSKDREGIGVRATVLVAMAGVVRKMSDQNSASAKDIALFLRVSWSTHPHHMTGE
jgi:hypothetical protein